MRFETDSAFHLDFYLAEQVLHCTVAEVRERLSMQEYMEWGVYLGRKAQAKQLANRG